MSRSTLKCQQWLEKQSEFIYSTYRRNPFPLHETLWSGYVLVIVQRWPLLRGCLYTHCAF